MSFTFNDLDLSSSKVSAGGGKFLTEGRYLVKIKNAEWVKSSKGSGSTTGYYNVKVPSSTESERIGREQLKTLLYWAGHPSPDKPGDINSLKGLVVGVFVGGKAENEGTSQERTYFKVRASFDPYELDQLNYKQKPAPTNEPKANPLLSETGTVVNF
jgi:hypothetical protein